MTSYTTAPTDIDRRAFENAYALTFQVTPTRGPDGFYYTEAIRQAWRMWCMARSLYTIMRDPPSAETAKPFFGAQ